MDSIEDDDLTNLCWLNESNKKELQSTGDILNLSLKKKTFCFGLVECSSNSDIDDDLKCLCWIIKMRPTSCYSQSLKVKY